MEGQHRVHLLGTSFTIRTAEDPEYFTSVLRYVEKKCEEIRRGMGLSDPLRIAIISSILVTDELFKSKAEGNQAEAIAEEMISLLDKNLEETSYTE